MVSSTSDSSAIGESYGASVIVIPTASPLLEEQFSEGDEGVDNSGSGTDRFPFRIGDFTEEEMKRALVNDNSTSPSQPLLEHMSSHSAGTPTEVPPMKKKKAKKKPKGDKPGVETEDPWLDPSKKLTGKIPSGDSSSNSSSCPSIVKKKNNGKGRIGFWEESDVSILVKKFIVILQKIQIRPKTHF